MDNFDSKIGVVAVLDILGYRSFLENNEPGIAVNEVLDVFKKARDRTQVMAFNPLAKTDEDKAELERIFKELNWLVFADTILLSIAYPKDPTKEQKLECWGAISHAVRFLYSHLFAWGLPVKGAVSYGNFVISEHCFAGRPILEAQRLMESLDLAAIALTPEAEKEFLGAGTTERAKWENNRYSIPLKDGRTPSLIVLLPTHLSLHKGVRQGVLESFLKHKKSIGPKEMSKVNNTEIFLQWCQSVLQSAE